MRKILLVSLGGAVGYVLGARAGRPAYDRIMERWTGFAGAVGFERLASTAAEAGADVRDSAASRFSTAVADSADSITDRLDAGTPSKESSTSTTSSLHEQSTPLDPAARR